MTLDLSVLGAGFDRRHPRCVTTVDSHTAGEGTRLVVGGLPDLPGSTVAAKRDHFARKHDHLRLRLCREPRGHRDTVAAVVTGPCSPGADFGLFYMDARRYPHLCGHATMGAVTTLLELGALDAAGRTEIPVRVDTPSGPVDATARMQDGEVLDVAVTMAPSFVMGERLPLVVPGLGTLRVDTVCVGGFFAMVDATAAGLALIPENQPRLTALGMDILRAANEQLTVSHPERPDVTTVDVVEFHQRDGAGDRGVVVYGQSHMDRSPCGTGTSAKLTLLHRKGLLEPGVERCSLGPLDCPFHAAIVEETFVGGLPAVRVRVRGSAFVTGMHRFVLDPTDPFPEGFLL